MIHFDDKYKRITVVQQSSRIDLFAFTVFQLE